MEKIKFTKEQLLKLKESYATGVLRVRFNDHEITYQNLDEMGRAIDRIQKEVVGSQGLKFTKFKVVRDEFIGLCN